MNALVRDPLSSTIVRASNALRTAETEIALYFANGKLRASKAESKQHQRRLLVHADGIVGVYRKGCEPSQIYEDIEEFYK